MEQTFTHSGDLGDIIYALPAIRAKGGGKLVLYDDPGKTAHGMTKKKMERIKPLLEYQDYIDEVSFSEEKMDSDLNGFRHHLGGAGSIADAHLSTQGLSWRCRATKWIEVDEPVHAFDVIVHRSTRYLNPRFPWHDIVREYKGRIGFAGFRDEHRIFCYQNGRVPFVEANDFMELARVIAGAKLFVGNQSSPCAVAHGMKMPMIMEICPRHDAQHHCVYQRMDCIIGWDEKIELPEVC